MKSKKTLFISTIVMVLVLVLSLSTATYAWFASSAAVTIDDIQMSTAAAEGLMIARVTNYVGGAFTLSSGPDGVAGAFGSSYSYSNVDQGLFWNDSTTTTGNSVYGVSGDGITMYKAYDNALTGGSKPVSLANAVAGTDYYRATFVIQNTKAAAQSVYLDKDAIVTAVAAAASGELAMASSARILLFAASMGQPGAVRAAASDAEIGNGYFATYEAAVAGGAERNGGSAWSTATPFYYVANMNSEQAYYSVTSELTASNGTIKLAYAPYNTYYFSNGALANNNATDRQAVPMAEAAGEYAILASAVTPAITYTTGDFANYFTRTGDGTVASPYVYTACTTDAQVVTGTTFNANIYQKVADQSAYAVGSRTLSSVYGGAYKFSAEGSLDADVVVSPSLANSQYVFVTIIIWFEGEDTECTGTYAGGGITADFMFSSTDAALGG